MIEQSTFTECIVASFLGLIAGFVVTWIMKRFEPGDWR